MPEELASVLAQDAVQAAPRLLGSFLSVDSPEGRVTLRITELEAYHGADDPGSHAFRGQTPRNSVMFGPAGHLYTYFTYGMHTCSNIVCGTEGVASGCLIRAGEIVEGIELARARRHTSRVDDDLARGPGRVSVALGITLADGGADLSSSRIRLSLGSEQPDIAAGPRTGVSGPGGTDAFPWRFWIPGAPTVSPYKRHVPKPRNTSRG
ncbi:DNA-3-methyladenine glycosylase [Salinibacterium sp. dk2585]|uniref:DNA-3-methyladenine glycosylase n=1 Tax=unclassified Salinibacterium TaxID=2632331 RepID=UPI0011C246B4|nr:MULTISPECIES: DNA-3-methyladenine glycosylase [unclassified Salinibacterium]QEE61628.1 DNA-3-methyladenine glycosylase [Salinibacterium sp. dk2585]TXK54820.1 DNA-3-methyladenine glycosylase [Salinibacterium sp. dk5596]